MLEREGIEAFITEIKLQDALVKKALSEDTQLIVTEDELNMRKANNMETIEAILWYQCNKEQITNNVPYEYIPWYYLLIIMMNYDVDINTLLSEYQYYNPLC